MVAECLTYNIIALNCYSMCKVPGLNPAQLLTIYQSVHITYLILRVSIFKMAASQKKVIDIFETCVSVEVPGRREWEAAFKKSNRNILQCMVF